MNKSGSRDNAIGFFGVLFIAFLVLKLTGVIAWSWWLVTAPLWGPALAAAIVTALVFAMAAMDK